MGIGSISLVTKSLWFQKCMGQFRNLAGLLSASGNVFPLAYALFIRPPEIHWPVLSPVFLFGWDPLLRIHVSGLSSVRFSILAYVEYNVCLKFGDSHCL